MEDLQRFVNSEPGAIEYLEDDFTRSIEQRAHDAELWAQYTGELALRDHVRPIPQCFNEQV